MKTNKYEVSMNELEAVCGGNSALTDYCIPERKIRPRPPKPVPNPLTEPRA